MTDRETIVANERYKAGSQILIQAGTALAGWAAVNVWNAGSFDFANIVYLVFGVSAVTAGFAILALLQPED